MPMSTSDLLPRQAYKEMARLERQWRRNGSGDGHGRDGRAQAKDNGDLRITVQWHKPLPKPRPWPRERERTDDLVVVRAQPEAVTVSTQPQKKHHQRHHALLDGTTIYHTTGQSTRARKSVQHDSTRMNIESPRAKVKSHNIRQSRTRSTNHRPRKCTSGRALYRLGDQPREFSQTAGSDHQRNRRLRDEQPKAVFRTVRWDVPPAPPGPSQRQNPSTQPPRQQTGTNMNPGSSLEKQKIQPRAHPSPKSEVHQRPSRTNAAGAKRAQSKPPNQSPCKASDEEKAFYGALYVKQKGFEGPMRKAAVGKDREEAVAERIQRRESREKKQLQRQMMRKPKQQNSLVFVSFSPAPSEEEMDISTVMALRPPRPRSPSQARPRGLRSRIP